MNMFPLIFRVAMMERELEDRQRKYRSQYVNDNDTDTARRPRNERSDWSFDRLRRAKPLIPPRERAVVDPCGCRTGKRPLEPAVSQCSSLRSGGSN